MRWFSAHKLTKLLMRSKSEMKMKEYLLKLMIIITMLVEVISRKILTTVRNMSAIAIYN